MPIDIFLETRGMPRTRVYKGETLVVKVLADVFEYEGETYNSLTAVAKQITGSHCIRYPFSQHALRKASAAVIT